MNFLAVFNLLSEILAAAPSVEASVEQAVTAWHGTHNDAEKAQAAAGDVKQVVDALSGVAAKTLAG